MKKYNNLYDSIILTIFLMIVIIFYIVFLKFAVIDYKAGTNPVISMIIGTILFGGLIVILTVIIIVGCYEKIIISDKKVESRKLFSKKIILKNDIDSVEIKTIPAIILGTYKTNSIVVNSKNKKINIYLSDNGKKLYNGFINNYFSNQLISKSE